MEQTAQNNAISRLAALFDDGIFTQIDSYAKGSAGEIEIILEYLRFFIHFFNFCINQRLQSIF